MNVIQHPAKPKFGILTGATLPQVYGLLGRFPSKAQMEGGRLTIMLTAANVEFLEAELPGVTWECKAVDEIKGLGIQADRVRAEKLAAAGGAEIVRATAYEFRTKPYRHQLQAFELRRDLKTFGYFMEMGTGKSKALIDDIADLRERNLIDLALILAPNGVHLQWITDHLPTHWPERVEMQAAYYQSDMRAAAKTRLNQALFNYPAQLKIITVNLEAMSFKSGEEFIEKVLKAHPDRCLLAIDESSKIKTPGSGRTKTAQRLGKLATYRRILSGSPVTKGVEDLYSQLKFLDERLLGFSSFFTFRNRYCEVVQLDRTGKPFDAESGIPKMTYAKDRPVERIVGYQRLDELQKKLDGWTFRVRKEDCLDLPPKVYVQRYVELTKEQRQFYHTLNEELMVMLADGTTSTAALAIVKLLRLQQIVCGHLPADDKAQGMLWQLPHAQNPRMKNIVDLVEESQGKVIVWARFKPDIEGLMEVLKPFKPVRYDGSVAPGPDRERAIKDYVEGEAGVFVASQQAGGIGIDGLQRVTTDVGYYSNSFDAELRWQSEDRAHRSGLKSRVTYHDLVARGTPDVKILRKLKERKDIADMTIDGLREMLLSDEPLMI